MPVKVTESTKKFSLNNTSKRTNLIFSTVPFWENRIVLNGFIKSVNDDIYDGLYLGNKTSYAVKLIDTNGVSWNGKLKFDRDGSLKTTAASVLAQIIKDSIYGRSIPQYKPEDNIIPNQYFTKGNLTYVIPTIIPNDILLIASF